MKPKIKPHQIILFDIDKTLHSTDEFKKLYQAHILENIFSDQTKFEESKKNYDISLKKRTFYHPRGLTKQLEKDLGISKHVFRNAYYKKQHFENALFSEAKEVLEKIGASNVLGVFTEGYKDFQTRKLKHGKILHYFNHQHLYIFFNKRTKRVLNLIPKNAVIIDDKPEVIEVLLKRADLTVIWLNRINNDKHPQAYTIHSLTELLGLV